MSSLINFFLRFTKTYKTLIQRPQPTHRKVLPHEYWLTCVSHAAGPGKQLHHDDVLFWMVEMLGSKKMYYSYVGNVLELIKFCEPKFFVWYRIVPLSSVGCSVGWSDDTGSWIPELMSRRTAITILITIELCFRLDSLIMFLQSHLSIA